MWFFLEQANSLEARLTTALTTEAELRKQLESYSKKFEEVSTGVLFSNIPLPMGPQTNHVSSVPNPSERTLLLSLVGPGHANTFERRLRRVQEGERCGKLCLPLTHGPNGTLATCLVHHLTSSPPVCRCRSASAISKTTTCSCRRRTRRWISRTCSKPKR